MNEPKEASRALAGRCLEVAGLADAATAWVGDDANRDKVGAETTSLRREFRRAGIRARKLANAATRNMCVGVYGPSQAGKSYLISVLGRPKGGELMAPSMAWNRSSISTGSTRKGRGVHRSRHPLHHRADCGAPGFPVGIRFLSRVRRGADPGERLRHGW